MAKQYLLKEPSIKCNFLICFKNGDTTFLSCLTSATTKLCNLINSLSFLNYILTSIVSLSSLNLLTKVMRL